MTETDSDTLPGTPLKGRHVLMYFLAFFGLMFAVNGVFLYQAITTHPGEETKKSYLQGLNYNSTLEARERQAALGWTAQIGIAETGEAVLVRILDADGEGVETLTVTGEMRRPDDKTLDREITFAARGDGLYRAETAGAEPGIWSMKVQAVEPGETEPSFEAFKKVGVK